MDELPATKSGSKHRTRHTPIIPLRALRLINQTGAGEHAGHVRPKSQSTKPSEYIAAPSARSFLHIHQLLLAHHWQAGQSGQRVDLIGLHPSQATNKSRGVHLRMGHLHRQRLHPCGFARLLRARFQGIVMLSHRYS